MIGKWKQDVSVVVVALRAQTAHVLFLECGRLCRWQATSQLTRSETRAISAIRSDGCQLALPECVEIAPPGKAHEQSFS